MQYLYKQIMPKLRHVRDGLEVF